MWFFLFILPIKLPYGLWDLTLEKKLHLNGDVKQQRRRRLRKRHLKSEFALLQTLSRLFKLVQFVKCWPIFSELNSKRLYQSSGKEKEVVVLCLRPRQNVKFGTFSRCGRAATEKKCRKKRGASAELLLCQSKPIAFLPFSLPSPLSLLKLP